MARKSETKGSESRLTGVEKGIRSLRASDATIIKEMQDGFARIESRLDQIYNHVDGFIKLHETLDIEFKVIKEQMRRLEERVEHLEAGARS
jgi:hypothetical protein